MRSTIVLNHDARVRLAEDVGCRGLPALLGLLAGVVQDAPATSRALLERFGSLGATLIATPPQLMSVADMTPAAVERLHAVNEARLCTLQEELRDRDIIGSWSAFERYALARLRHCPVEQARGLFLDRKNGLIADELLGQGTIDHVPLYPREVARKALELHASAMILVHNHPSGDPTPSAADIAMTKRVAAALATLEVALHDHAIVGRNHVLSMRSSGHL